MMFTQAIRMECAITTLGVRRYIASAVSLPNIVSLSSDTTNRIFNVIWSDGKKGRFPFVWLRDTSPDAKTYTMTTAMTARNLHMRDFDVEVTPVNAFLKHNEVHVEWPNGVHSRYSSEWLRLRNPSDLEARAKRREVYLNDVRLWDAKQIEKRLKRFAFSDIVRNDEILHDFLVAVCIDGIAVSEGGPEDAVAQIGHRIGLIHRTHFGEIFEVSTKPDASNMAYSSSGELPLHTDFPSLAHPPQLQMLHMKQRADQGGLNMFVDGFHIAHLLRRDNPEQFDLLRKVKVEYIEQGYDVHQNQSGESETFSYDMAARHAVIRTNESGKVNGIQFGNAMRSWFYECEADEILSVYRAMKRFTELCYHPQNLFYIQLQNGDTVLWANTRLLHSRSAFSSAESGRSRVLTGCYFSWDILKSRIRTLRDTLDHPLNQPAA